MVSRTSKFRGSRTHGRGKKSGRGGGIHGGRGNAGLHKHKYKHMLKFDPEHFGRKGFKRPPEVKKEKRSINLRELEEALPGLLHSGMAIKDEGLVCVDLTKMGIDKLLAKGRIRAKLKVDVKEASERAKAKIEASGGHVSLSISRASEKKNSEVVNA